MLDPSQTNSILVLVHSGFLFFRSTLRLGRESRPRISIPFSALELPEERQLAYPAFVTAEEIYGADTRHICHSPP